MALPKTRIRNYKQLQENVSAALTRLHNNKYVVNSILIYQRYFDQRPGRIPVQ
uniref:Uncharacterized protein n=1 Tax=Arundo donax TaxID=35708 RepID=A0A0A8ZLV4_ARUDO